MDRVDGMDVRGRRQTECRKLVHLARIASIKDSSGRCRAPPMLAQESTAYLSHIFIFIPIKIHGSVTMVIIHVANSLTTQPLSAALPSPINRTTASLFQA